MTVRDGQPSPAQARMMAKVFVIATLLGGLVVFLNVTMRSYNLRLMQQAEKAKSAEQQAAKASGAAAEQSTAPAQPAPASEPTVQP